MDVKSEFMKLSQNDLVKGVVVAALSAATGGIYAALEGGVVLTSSVFAAAGKTGLMAGLAYLMKNFFTNSNDQLMKPEDK